MIGVILGTGPSLANVADELRQLKADGKVMLFGMNNSYKDFDLDVWLACDPKWHEVNGKVELACDQWHWDKDICERYGYRHIPGLWLDGLSTDPDYISFGHSSGWQCLNLALHYGCDPILLCGYDMSYPDGKPRHYFTELSDVDGEYPAELRKWSLFDKPDQTGLLYDYKHIADQCNRGEIPQIYNCTPGSAMKWFPMAEIQDFIDDEPRHDCRPSEIQEGMDKRASRNSMWLRIKGRSDSDTERVDPIGSITLRD